MSGFHVIYLKEKENTNNATNFLSIDHSVRHRKQQALVRKKNEQKKELKLQMTCAVLNVYRFRFFSAFFFCVCSVC